MSTYQVRFTEEAQDDLLRLYDFLLELDLDAAEHALQVIKDALRLLDRSSSPVDPSGGR